MPHSFTHSGDFLDLLIPSHTQPCIFPFGDKFEQVTVIKPLYYSPSHSLSCGHLAPPYCFLIYYHNYAAFRWYATKTKLVSWESFWLCENWDIFAPLSLSLSSLLCFLQSTKRGHAIFTPGFSYTDDELFIKYKYIVNLLWDYWLS